MENHARNEKGCEKKHRAFVGYGPIKLINCISYIMASKGQNPLWFVNSDNLIGRDLMFREHETGGSKAWSIRCSVLFCIILYLLKF